MVTFQGITWCGNLSHFTRQIKATHVDVYKPGLFLWLGGTTYGNPGW